MTKSKLINCNHVQLGYIERLEQFVGKNGAPGHIKIKKKRPGMSI